MPHPHLTRRKMTIFLILPFLLGNFVQKWVIPDGKNSYGRIVVGDVDHDGLTDIVVRRNQEIKVMFYELNLQNQWQLQDSIVDDGDHLVWGLGDFDLDGYSDLVFQKSFGIPNVGIAIYESADSFSYPTQEVWRDTVGFPLVSPVCCYDIDQDSLPEIVKIIGDTTDFDIYESVGDNFYMRVFRDTIPASHSPMSTVAFGDFDLDNQHEFVFGYTGGEYNIWECTGDNSYQEILLQQLPTVNITDCFSVPDADGDGKMEFVAKGFVVSTARIHAFVFEATSNNTYEIIKTFDLPGGSVSYYGGYSDVGDVDGDSIPEIALEGCQNIYIIKAVGNDSFYIWDTLPGNASGSSIAVYDIDDNGLAEIVISGNNETRIYEYDAGAIEETALRLTPDALRLLEVSPNPFKDKLNIRYKISDKNRVNMKIYNAAGFLVKDFSLYSSGIGGQVSVKVWDGKDNSGQQVPSGVYFVRLETPNKSITKKIIKLK